MNTSEIILLNENELYFSKYFDVLALINFKMERKPMGVISAKPSYLGENIIHEQLTTVYFSKYFDVLAFINFKMERKPMGVSAKPSYLGESIIHEQLTY